MTRRLVIAVFLVAVCCIEGLRWTGFAKSAGLQRLSRTLHYTKRRPPSKIFLSDTTEPNCVLQENSTENPNNYANETLADAGALDPVQRALIEEEKVLRSQLSALEADLRSRRQQLSKLRDRTSESGRNGFFIVQAQRRKDAEQKKRVAQNKREFVSKMLPWVDEFRSVPLSLPADSVKGLNMHESYGTLLQSVLAVFEKYGYKEYTPEVGEVLDATIHEVVRVADVEDRLDVEENARPGLENTVYEVQRPGMRSADGDILRKARVVAYGERPPPITPMPESETPPMEEGEFAATALETEVNESTADWDRWSV